MIVDGRAVAHDALSRLRTTGLLDGTRLGVLLGSSDPVTQSFVRIKEQAARDVGVEIERVSLRADATTQDAQTLLKGLESRVDGVIVQLPLPDGIDTDEVLSALDPRKDVDGISRDPQVLPPVARAIKELIDRERISISGKRAAVVGSGRLVGRPAATLLASLGADVVALTETDSLDALKDAAVVVLGAGHPGLVKPSDLTHGVVLFDAGTSESGGKVVGDADPACAAIASLFTPVPGGIGPIAVMMIFANLYDLVEKARA